MKIPLFPLHTVLCPGIVVPLHIFEERYREMTRRCLDTGEPFGVVLIRDGREVGPRSISTLAGVGAFAEIRRAGRYPDGRYDLLAAGTGRFLIDSVDAGSAAYLVADVTPLDDEVGDEPRAERLAATAIGRFVRYLELMRARDGETADVLDIQVEVEAAGSADDSDEDEDEDEDEDVVTDEEIAGAIAAVVAESAPAGAADSDDDDDDDDDGEEVSAADLVIPDDPTVLSYLLSGIVSIELPRRQALLEADTTVARLEGLIRILDREILLLGERLRLFTPDLRVLGGARRS